MSLYSRFKRKFSTRKSLPYIRFLLIFVICYLSFVNTILIKVNIVKGRDVSTLPYKISLILLMFYYLAVILLGLFNTNRYSMPYIRLATMFLCAGWTIVISSLVGLLVFYMGILYDGQLEHENVFISDTCYQNLQNVLNLGGIIMVACIIHLLLFSFDVKARHKRILQKMDINIAIMGFSMALRTRKENNYDYAKILQRQMITLSRKELIEARNALYDSSEDLPIIDLPAGVSVRSAELIPGIPGINPLVPVGAKRKTIRPSQMPSLAFIRTVDERPSTFKKATQVAFGSNLNEYNKFSELRHTRTIDSMSVIIKAKKPNIIQTLMGTTQKLTRGKGKTIKGKIPIDEFIFTDYRANEPKVSEELRALLDLPYESTTDDIEPLPENIPGVPGINPRRSTAIAIDYNTSWLLAHISTSRFSTEESLIAITKFKNESSESDMEI